MIDAHTHLDDRQFAPDLQQVVERALAAGVTTMITTGDDLATSRMSVEIADRYDSVYAVVGVHPHHAAIVSTGYLDELREMASHPKVVALGEMGLDYFKNRSPKDDQQRVFREQLELAAELRLPVVIHCRDAGYDNYRMLAEWAKTSLRVEGRPLGVLHCFSEDATAADRYVKLGFYISFAGPVTYPTAQNLWAVAQNVPLDRFTVETDAPYLPPQSHRGKRNEPSYVTATAARIAALRQIDVREVEAASDANAAALYGLPVAAKAGVR